MFLTYLTLISGISLSIIAADYSIIGLAALFAGATSAIIAMGGALEVAKLVMASWLYNNWHNSLLPKSIKYYLTSAVVILIFITSLGIFGFLSKAHLDQVVPENNNALPILVNPVISPPESVRTDILKEISAIIRVRRTPVAI